MHDFHSGRPLGFGFVGYDTEEAAQAAVDAMDGQKYVLLKMRCSLKKLTGLFLG